MEGYRLYAVEESGHVQGPSRNINAASDAEAFRMATEMLADDETLELWRGPDYVAMLTRNPALALSDCIVVVRA